VHPQAGKCTPKQRGRGDFGAIWGVGSVLAVSPFSRNKYTPEKNPGYAYPHLTGKPDQPRFTIIGSGS